MHARSVASDNSCNSAKEPSENQLHEQWTNYTADHNHESMYMLPHMKQRILGALEKDQESFTYSIDPTAESCPSRLDEIAGNTWISGRSICPWHYVMNFDQTR